MTSRFKQVGVLATLLLGAVSAQAALCNLTTGNLSICYGELASPVGVVSGDPLAARGEFGSFLKTIGTETFLGVPVGAVSPLSLNFGAITGTMSGSTIVPSPVPGGTDTVVSHVSVVGNAVPDTNEGRFGTSGNSFNDERFILVGNGDLAVTFSEAVSAFGFYGTDIGDFGGSIFIDLINTAGTTTITLDNSPAGANPPSGSLLFWGFVDTKSKYDQVRFRFTDARDGIGFDDLVTGTLKDDLPPPNPTPEPAGLALLGAAFAAAALARRRTRRTD